MTEILLFAIYKGSSKLHDSEVMLHSLKFEHIVVLIPGMRDFKAFLIHKELWVTINFFRNVENLTH